MSGKLRLSFLSIIIIVVMIIGQNPYTSPSVQADEFPVGLALFYYWSFGTVNGSYAEWFDNIYIFTQWIDPQVNLVEIHLASMRNYNYTPETNIYVEGNYTYEEQFPAGFVSAPGMNQWPLWVNVSQVTVGENYTVHGLDFWVLESVESEGLNCFNMTYYWEWGDGDLLNETTVCYHSLSGIAIVGVTYVWNTSIPSQYDLIGNGFFRLDTHNIGDFFDIPPTVTTTTTTTETTATTTPSIPDTGVPFIGLDLVFGIGIVIEIFVIILILRQRK